MDISYNWLRSVAPTIDRSAEEIAEALGMLGAPVDELVPLGDQLGDIVIARVEEVRPHPNADRLRLCTVNAGGEPLQVVCGAPNVEPGRYYPFAPIGATIPGGLKIKKAKLRGEASEGMLCSARELGLGRDHEGLMKLTGEWQPGEAFVAGMGLDDWRMVLDVTPNRPDLLSHVGVAREVARRGVEDIELPAFIESFRAPETVAVGTFGEVDDVRVSIADPEKCARYMAAIVRGVRVGPSPEWLAGRLRAIGLRPINNIVDATNYVLHEMGQPLHAFDLARLQGPAIEVRGARTGETIRTLDGVDRSLTPEMLVIADASRPVAVAGVMGGEDSEVGPGTTDVLLECALFDARSVRATARALGLSSDASYRFERGVDPELQPAALARVVELIIAVAGGTPAPSMVDLAARPVGRHMVEVRATRVSKVLGMQVDEVEIESLLAPIGFAVDAAGEALRVTVPGYRPDVMREIDVIEEIARRRGYDSFPEVQVGFRPSIVPEDPLRQSELRAREVLGRWGFFEARTSAFGPAGEQRVPLLHPLSSEESHLRDALVPGLLRRLEHNWAHGVRNVRLFEIGTAFFPSGDAPRERWRVAAVFTGAADPPHWASPERPYDVWDLKALASEIAEALRAGSLIPADAAPFGDLAPAVGAIESAAMLVARSDDAGGIRGIAGRVRDGAVDAPAWAGDVWAMEFEVTEAAARDDIVYQPLPGHPGSERDLALIVPLATPAAEVEAVIREAAGGKLVGVWPFDLYEGPGVQDGARSIAWRLTFRDPARTLKDSEVDAAIASVLRALEERLGVVRR